MSKFEIPGSGITIQQPSPAKTPNQTVRLRLPATDVQNLIKHLQEGGTAKFKVGKILAVEYGPRRLPLHRGTDAHVQEIYSRPVDNDGPMHLASKVSHILELQHAQEVLQKSEAAFKALKSQVDQAREERASLDSSKANKLLKAGHRPSPLSAGLQSSRPSSPFLSAGFSPRIGPTSAPLLSGQNKEEKIKQDAIKIPLIHLLAMGPHDPTDLAQKLRIKRTMLDPLLLKVAKDDSNGTKSLKDRQFRDLDVWKFPYTSQGDRQKAIDNAISAFDRQRIDKTDKLWQMLLAKEDRGKGTYLSKLNFDKPLNPGNLTPRMNERSTDGTSTGGKSMGSLGSGDSNKGKVATTKPNDKPKPSIDKIVKNLTKGISVTKDSGKASGRNTPIPKEFNVKKPATASKPVSKFKSAEKIVDSDEEVNTNPSTTAPRAKRVETEIKSTKVITSNQRLATGSNKTPLQRPPTLATSTSQRDSDRGRLSTTAAMIKTRGGKDADVPKAATAPASRNPSRPRTNSSPNKPSPLGSSPPTNGRAGDTSGTSSKGTPASSAASTPPPSTDTSRDSQRTIGSIKKTDKLTNGVKRKAEAHNDAPVAKKQQSQVNGNSSHRLEARAGLPSGVNHILDKKLPKKHDNTESDGSASPEKPMTREDIVEEARKFQLFYTKYKDAHEAADREKESAQKDKMIDKVWNMHKRLKDMKTKIWREWERIEKQDP